MSVVVLSRERWRSVRWFLKVLSRLQEPALVRRESVERQPRPRHEWEQQEAYARNVFRQRF